MPTLTIADMKYGQQADGGIREDARFSARRLVNYDIIYGGEKPRLRVRPGYERWNAVALPVTARQLHAFVDMQGNNHIIARVGTSRWYDVQEAGAHTLISSFAATIKKPIFQYGNRLMLGTDGTDSDDSGLIWTDHDSLDTGSPATSYRVGIKRPTEPPTIDTTTAVGNIDTLIGGTLMNRTTRRKFAIQYDTGASEERIGSIRLKTSVTNQGTTSGSWHVRIYPDNGGEPDDTMVSETAISDPVDVSIFNLYPSYGTRLWTFQEVITLDANTTYWFQVLGDEEYYDGYSHSTPTDSGDRVAILGFTDAPFSYGESKVWDTTAGPAAWITMVEDITLTPREAYFYLSGIDFDKDYGFVITYYNDTYQIESRPSEEKRIKIDEGEMFQLTGYTLPTDPQITHIRLYRREMDSIFDSDDNITDEFKFIAEVESPATLDDNLPTSLLGSYLQTEDHFCLDDFDEEEGTGYRTEAIVPIGGCMWKGRAWIFAANSNQLAYGKILEENGATGLLGLSAPDFFPLSNTMTLPEAADIVDCHALSNDQLLVFLSNETVYVIYGGNQSLNPPVDFNVSQVADTHGLINMGAFAPVSSSIYYMSRDGIWSIFGIGIVTQIYQSETNASILKDIETQYLRNTEMQSFGNEIWSLIDTNNDGEPDTILIMILEREELTRGMYERSWKMYQYDVDIRDLTMLNTGDEFREIYAVDADNPYILKLNTGTLDNGNSIAAYIESHDLIAENQSMINQIDLDAKMANEADGSRPTYTWLLTDHADRTVSGTMAPNSNEDIRGFRSGTRLKGPVSVRARVSQVSVVADELRSVTMTYTGE